MIDEDETASSSACSAHKGEMARGDGMEPRGREEAAAAGAPDETGSGRNVVAASSALTQRSAESASAQTARKRWRGKRRPMKPRGKEGADTHLGETPPPCYRRPPQRRIELVLV